MNSGERPKVAVITGATGFLGRRVAAEFVANGFAVISVSDSLRGPELCHHRTIDLSSPGVARSWKGRAEAVIHLAAMSGGIQSQRRSDLLETNRRMTQNALEIASRSEARDFVLASSASVYRPTAEVVPLSETAQLVDPTTEGYNDYAASKIESEQQARSWGEHSGARVIALRFATLFGPGFTFDPRTSNVVHSLIERTLQLRHDDPLEVWGDGSFARSFCYVDDASSALAHVFNRPSSEGVFNVSAGQGIEISTLARQILRLSGRDTSEIRFRTDMPGGDGHRVLDSTRLLKSGFRHSFSVEVGLSLTIAHSEQKSKQ